MASKSAVFIVASGSLTNGVPLTTTFVQSQVESLRNAGWEATLGIVDDRTSVEGIMRNVRRLREEISQSNAGLVHAQYGSMTAGIARWAKGRLPLLISFCGDDLLGTPSPGLVWRIRERCARSVSLWAAHGAAAVIVKSDNLLRTLPNKLQEKGLVLPNGVDIDWFRPMNRGECRLRLGWDKQAKVVLFNKSRGEDEFRKNPSLAHAAIRLVSTSIPNVSLHVVSNSSTEEMRLMLNAADCLLVTSLHEGSPNIVKEAMACNLPVVSVPCGDVVERLKATQPGMVCPYDASALACGMAVVLGEGHRSNGREQLVAQGLTVSRVAERLIQLYHSIQKGTSLTREADRRACVE